MPVAILERVLSLFSGAGDPEAEKRKLLKQIVKELAKHKYKFYRPRGEDALPPLAKFFYDLYRVVAPAQVFLQNAENSAQLKSIVIDSFLDKNLLELQDRLSDDTIRERAKTTPTKELSQQLKDELVNYFSGFDGDRVRAIDSCYNSILAFTRFVNFDYFFLLKKYDSNLSERNFTYIPKFESIRAEYVGEDLKDFLEVLLALDFEQDWKPVFNALRAYKGVEVVAADQWSKSVSVLRDVRRSLILELIVRHIDKNPNWKAPVNRSEERIVDPYLQKLKTQTEVAVQRILQEKRNSKIEELAVAVFGTSSVSRLKNYTDKANITFSRKMLGGYTNVQGLNYLKAFLLDFFKKDIRELVDLFLIRGQWSTNMLSQQLSEGFHELMEISEKLIAFDESLADDGDLGGRLRTSLAKADRDKDQLKHLRILLKGVNDDAQRLVNGSAQALIAVGKNLKSLLEDYQRIPHELLINWKELELASEHSIDERV
ncbi:MAG TPA: hypothetical protein DIC34_16560, partial [Treponema sp.]|nr:hypothetical protein [Treponema sp.]